MANELHLDFATDNYLISIEISWLKCLLDMLCSDYDLLAIPLVSLYLRAQSFLGAKPIIPSSN